MLQLRNQTRFASISYTSKGRDISRSFKALVRVTVTAYLLPFKCVASWDFKRRFVLNDFPHTPHLNAKFVASLIISSISFTQVEKPKRKHNQSGRRSEENRLHTSTNDDLLNWNKGRINKSHSISIKYFIIIKQHFSVMFSTSLIKNF